MCNQRHHSRARMGSVSCVWPVHQGVHLKNQFFPCLRFETCFCCNIDFLESVGYFTTVQQPAAACAQQVFIELRSRTSYLKTAKPQAEDASRSSRPTVQAATGARTSFVLFIKLTRSHSSSGAPDRVHAQPGHSGRIKFAKSITTMQLIRLSMCSYRAKAVLDYGNNVSWFQKADLIGRCGQRTHARASCARTSQARTSGSQQVRRSPSIQVSILCNKTESYREKTTGRMLCQISGHRQGRINLQVEEYCFHSSSSYAISDLGRYGHRGSRTSVQCKSRPAPSVKLR